MNEQQAKSLGKIARKHRKDMDSMNVCEDKVFGTSTIYIDWTIKNRKIEGYILKNGNYNVTTSEYGVYKDD